MFQGRCLEYSEMSIAYRLIGSSAVDDKMFLELRAY